jgi:hypothetical protein
MAPKKRTAPSGSAGTPVGKKRKSSEVIPAAAGTRRSARSSQAKTTAKDEATEPKELGKGTTITKSKGKAEQKTEKAKAKATAKPATNSILPSTDRKEGEIRYWLMKAEPNSRIENGIDVKFSIDDLAAKTVPEPWDGIRNHVAKNNILAMRKGDLAFFYHSNCKVPAVVGIMEVVGEAIPDGKFSIDRIRIGVVAHTRSDRLGSQVSVLRSQV